MNTTSISLEQYREAKAEESRSDEEKLTRLVGGNAELQTRQWTDEQIRGIPEHLVAFAYENSGTLRQEFEGVEIFVAYRKATGRYWCHRVTGR